MSETTGEGVTCSNCNGSGVFGFLTIFGALLGVTCWICFGSKVELPPVIDRLPEDEFRDYGGEG